MQKLFDRRLLPQIFYIGLPVVVAVTSVSIMNIVDLKMVGYFGSEAIVAVGLGGWVYLILVMSFQFLEIGAQVIVARRFGEGKLAECGVVINNALIVAAVTGLLFTLFFFSCADLFLHPRDPVVRDLGVEYLRWRVLGIALQLINFALKGFFYGIGKPHPSLYAELLQNGANVFLNWVFIFGHLGAPGMGPPGAGLASALSAAVGCLFLVSFTWLRGYGATFHLAQAGRFNLQTVRLLLKVGGPASVHNFLCITAWAIFMHFNERISVTAASATQIVLTLLMFGFLPALGFGTAAATLVGQNLGAGRPDVAERVGWTTWILGESYILIWGIFIILFRKPLVGFFVQDPDVIALGAQLLILIAFVETLDSTGIIFSKALQGAGRTTFVMLAEVFFAWVIFLPAAYFIGLKYQKGVW
ncbi:MAG: MATE family efflux transporter, partial [bacterium]